MTNWINARTKPNRGGRYIVYADGVVTTAYYACRLDGGCWDNPGVKWWMPLPEPPIEV